MSEETVSVVVCHEGTPSNTYTLRDMDLGLVMETIGRVISWRSMEDRIEEALRKLAEGYDRGKLPGWAFEKFPGRHVDNVVVVVDMTVEKNIVITLEGS